MKRRLMLAALVAAVPLPVTGQTTDHPTADVMALARLEVPERLPPDATPTYRVVRHEGPHGPGFAEEGTVDFFVQGHLIFSTSDGCHIAADGIRRCGWWLPKVVAAGEGVAAFSLPEASSFSILRDGRVQVEIPVNFEIVWLRFDGEHIWAMPEDYVTGDTPPQLFSPDGQPKGVPKYWEAR